MHAVKPAPSASLPGYLPLAASVQFSIPPHSRAQPLPNLYQSNGLIRSVTARSWGFHRKHCEDPRAVHFNEIHFDRKSPSYWFLLLIPAISIGYLLLLSGICIQAPFRALPSAPWILRICSVMAGSPFLLSGRAALIGQPLKV